jgi:hypothetical protein
MDDRLVVHQIVCQYGDDDGDDLLDDRLVVHQMVCQYDDGDVLLDVQLVYDDVDVRKVDPQMIPMTLMIRMIQMTQMMNVMVFQCKDDDVVCLLVDVEEAHMEYHLEEVLMVEVLEVLKVDQYEDVLMDEVQLEEGLKVDVQKVEVLRVFRLEVVLKVDLYGHVVSILR